MSFAATVLKVLIASPGDTREYREAIEAAMHDWNGSRSELSAVILLPRRWETNAVPLLEADGQSVINKQLVQDADIVFGVFHATLGRATPRAASGTAEELQQGVDAGKPVHVYFGTMPVPASHDREQLAALDAFKHEAGKRGLYGSFDDTASLKDQVRRALEHDVSTLGLAIPPIQAVPLGAALIAEYFSVREAYNDSKGRIKYRTRGQKLTIRNLGSARAESVTVRLSALNGGEAPDVHQHAPVHPTIAPGGLFTFPLMLHMGSARSVLATFTWLEDGVEHEDTQTVSLL